MAAVEAYSVPFSAFESTTRRFRKDSQITWIALTEVSVASVEWLSSTSIRVHFNIPVLDNAALRSPDVYLISDTAALDPAPDRTVYTVTPEDVENPTYVDLVMEEQRTGVTYQCEVSRLTQA